MSFFNAQATQTKFLAVKRISPGKGGFDEGDVPVDRGAVPEGFDVGGVDGHCVDQSANPDSVTGWRKRKTVRLFV